MTKKNKMIYKNAQIEVLMISEADVIATSTPDDYVDKNENSWVVPGGNGEWN